MKVDIERLLEIKAELRKINQADLIDIEWHEGGVEVAIPLSLIDEWEFTGLNNTDFITSDYYLRKALD